MEELHKIREKMAKYENSKDTKKSEEFLVSHENKRFSGHQKSSISACLRNHRFQRDKAAYEIVSKELDRFNKLVEGHKKLLIAIGNL